MGQYAKHTTVSPEKSRIEVERVLSRYGASGFGYSWDRREVVITPVPMYGPKTEQREYATIVFQVKARRVRLDLPIPNERQAGTQAKAEAQARQRWRALVLVIKAKLEAVESGISTLEEEFLANLVTESGRTIGEVIVPQLSEAVKAGRLLPARSDAP